MDLQLKQMEKQNIEISHNMGVQMFTNFSHELRNFQLCFPGFITYEQHNHANGEC